MTTAITITQPRIELVELPQVEMIPVAMVTPAAACIYAPSRLHPPAMISKADFNRCPPLGEMLVSFAPDGKSDPRRMAYYGFAPGYWIRAPEPQAIEPPPPPWAFMLAIVIFGTGLAVILFIFLL